jgi:hypothetical protein
MATTLLAGEMIVARVPDSPEPPVDGTAYSRLLFLNNPLSAQRHFTTEDTEKHREKDQMEPRKARKARNSIIILFEKALFVPFVLFVDSLFLSLCPSASVRERSFFLLPEGEGGS